MRLTLVAVAIVLALLVPPPIVLAGDEPPNVSLPWQFDVPQRAFEEKGQAGYLEAVLGLEEREAKATPGPERRLFLDMYLTVLPFVGEHEGVFQREPELRRLFGARRPDVSPLPGGTPRDAVTEILSAAASRRIVMFNEEHRASIQRAFMHRLIGPLRELGFTHLAVEALHSGQAASVNEKGHPTLSAGLYPRDPVFGDLLRRARALGYTIVEYDTHSPQTEGMSPLDAMNAREAGQAYAIHDRTLGRDPKARVVIHGGRHHISEKQGASGWRPMGRVLKDIAGTDPLSVDLMVMVARADPELETDAYAHARKSGWLSDDPIVVAQPSGRSQVGSFEGALDMLVLHPRARDVEGRSHWLLMGGLRKPVRVAIDASVITQPLLLQAFMAGEPSDAVPVDQVILRPGKAIPALMLRPARYRVRLIDRSGKPRWTRSIEVSAGAPAQGASRQAR